MEVSPAEKEVFPTEEVTDGVVDEVGAIGAKDVEFKGREPEAEQP
jgi:hypothetical protein